ncbi:hypothetical protein KCP77_11910 [Salmonella enterica subsp. enterica]|nr:hypothetical protein KCP77_11910 [Salmonella enterica subsp. enterica]
MARMVPLTTRENQPGHRIRSWVTAKVLKTPVDKLRLRMRQHNHIRAGKCGQVANKCPAARRSQP